MDEGGNVTEKLNSKIPRAYNVQLRVFDSGRVILNRHIDTTWSGIPKKLLRTA